MKIKCSWCGSWINDYDESCPNCGGKNDNFKRQAVGVPRTVEELKEWAAKHNLPLMQMRTFIGENYTGAKAFGIYKDENTGNFIVYKNKADGSRAIRYEGPDEAYAVNELYQKMKERVAQQKSHQKAIQKRVKKANGPVYLNTGNPVGYENRRDDYWQGNGNVSRNRGGSKSSIKTVFLFLIALQLSVMVLTGIFSLFRSASGKKLPDGYYNYNGNIYYWQNSTDAWYIYDDDRWNTCYDDLDIFDDNYTDYRIGTFSTDNYDVTDFRGSGYYKETFYDSGGDSGWDSDWDDDYYWDSGSDWDSSIDDWDSDW